MLNNIHDMPQEENLCNEQGNAINREIVKDCNYHMGYVIKDDRMTNTYSISHQTWSGQKAVFPSVRSGYSDQLHNFYNNNK